MITVLPGEEGSDFDLDASYYVIIGTGGNPGNEQSLSFNTAMYVCNVSKFNNYWCIAVLTTYFVV